MKFGLYGVKGRTDRLSDLLNFEIWIHDLINIDGIGEDEPGICDLNHKMAALNHNLAGSSDIHRRKVNDPEPAPTSRLVIHAFKK